MDGITRNTSGFDSELTHVLGPVLIAAIVGLIAVVAIAVGAEILRRAGVAAATVGRLDRLLPVTARRIAAGLLSVTVTVLGSTPASASDAPVRDWLSGTTTTTTIGTRSTTIATTTTTSGPVATEGALLERVAPSPPAPAAPISPYPAPSPPEAVVVVVEGDCLWSIAARRLGPDASNLAIDKAWRAIYARNHAVVGDDPNLIFPGQELALPPTDPSPYAAP